jgi:hypothetical protein
MGRENEASKFILRCDANTSILEDLDIISVGCFRPSDLFYSGKQRLNKNEGIMCYDKKLIIPVLYSISIIYLLKAA